MSALVGDLMTMCCEIGIDPDLIENNFRVIMTNDVTKHLSITKNVSALGSKSSCVISWDLKTGSIKPLSALCDRTATQTGCLSELKTPLSSYNIYLLYPTYSPSKRVIKTLILTEQRLNSNSLETWKSCIKNKIKEIKTTQGRVEALRWNREYWHIVEEDFTCVLKEILF